MKRLASLFLALGLLAPGALLAQQKTAESAALSSPPASSAAQAGPQSQASRSERPQPPPYRRRPYERETNPRHHSGISKQEIAFLAAIAGTSMGIGAIAGGAKGLAIGSIVGGWSAYAAHRLWKWIK